MEKSPTIRYLQEYLKSKDYKGSTPDPYFYKLVEEVGELSRAIFREVPPATDENFKGSVLPETGGIGTTLFYAIGGLMVAAAVVLLVTKKRMTAE